MIQQRAKGIGPLPNPSGRKTEITPQEKSAAKKLILAMREVYTNLDLNETESTRRLERCSTELEGYSDQVTSVAFSPDSKLIV